MHLHSQNILEIYLHLQEYICICKKRTLGGGGVEPLFCIEYEPPSDPPTPTTSGHTPTPTFLVKYVIVGKTCHPVINILIVNMTLLRQKRNIWIFFYYKACTTNTHGQCMTAIYAEM